MIFVEHERALKAPKTTSNKWLKNNKLNKIHSICQQKQKSFENTLHKNTRNDTLSILHVDYLYITDSLPGYKGQPKYLWRGVYYMTMPTSF
jgi:hypothetical protein